MQCQVRVPEVRHTRVNQEFGTGDGAPHDQQTKRCVLGSGNTHRIPRPFLIRDCGHGQSGLARESSPVVIPQHPGKNLRRSRKLGCVKTEASASETIYKHRSTGDARPQPTSLPNPALRMSMNLLNFPSVILFFLIFGPCLLAAVLLEGGEVSQL